MFTATKHIHVSYGHRIPTHGSACRSPHGHTGRIEATCAAAQLIESGEQTDMVVDFGFLQKLLMETVHAGIDHGFVLSMDDTEMLKLFFDPSKGLGFEAWHAQLCKNVQARGFDVPGNTLSTFKLYVMPHAPTAERLAEHFFKRMEADVKRISEGRARLANIRFWESPTSHADFPGRLDE